MSEDHPAIQSIAALLASLPFDFLWVLLPVGLIALLLLVGLWRRQGRVLSQLADQKNQIALLSQSLTLGQQEFEKRLLDEMAREGGARREAAQDLQQRLLHQITALSQSLEQRIGDLHKQLIEDSGRLRTDLVERFDNQRHALAQNLTENRLAQQEGLTQGLEKLGRQLHEGLGRHSEELGKRVTALTDSTDQRLKEISGQVEKRLSEGFEKTTETFSKVLEHLTRIDEAQRRITELSKNVVNLQEVLADKRSRGAFGEVQLEVLVRNLIPERHFFLQKTLSNGTRVDCLIKLPEPTGDIAIDAKFPLESYRGMTDADASDQDRAKASTQFKIDIRKHIHDIADKYIIPGETSDGAVMFMPAESVFAEIHAHFPDLVEEAYNKRVWMVSPTTMMAILTTARAVLKDAATREQVHVIQRHLQMLSKDFGRFQMRMDKLSRHIKQAHQDVDDVHISARKISDRFGQIEQVELDELPEQESGLSLVKPSEESDKS
ncbi:MAG: DNA recombination protein RmuC [Gammaproteobacteria bacterium]|nr:DNA recombination protein RmuC [Gammaproteobacteria bacterium]